MWLWERGDAINIARKALGGGGLSHPTALPQEKRLGSNDRTRPTGEMRNGVKGKKGPLSDDQKVVIDAPVLRNVARAEKFRPILSRPEYAHNDDELDDLMTEANYYYDIQCRDFVDDAYLSMNFTHAEIRPGELRSARVASRGGPVGKNDVTGRPDSL